MFNRWFVVALTLAVSGCFTAPFQLIDQSEPIPPGRTWEVIGPAVGEACSLNFGGICAFGLDESVRAALNAAKKSSGADALVEVAIDRRYQWFVIMNQTCTRVTAKAIRIK